MVKSHMFKTHLSSEGVLVNERVVVEDHSVHF